MKRILTLAVLVPFGIVVTIMCLAAFYWVWELTGIVGLMFVVLLIGLLFHIMRAADKQNKETERALAQVINSIGEQ